MKVVKVMRPAPREHALAPKILLRAVEFTLKEVRPKHRRPLLLNPLLVYLLRLVLVLREEGTASSKRNRARALSLARLVQEWWQMLAMACCLPHVVQAHLLLYHASSASCR